MDNKIVEDLQKNFADVLTAQKERTEAENISKKDVAAKIEAQNKAADAMIEKMDAIEAKNAELAKKNDDLETAFARGFGEESEAKAAELELNENVIRSYKEVPKSFVYDREALETHKKAFDIWFKSGNTGLYNSGASWTPDQQKFINTVIDPQGGFLTAPQYSTTVIPKKFNGRAIVDLVDRMTIGGGTYIEPVDASDWNDAEFSNELADEPTDSNNEAFEDLVFYPHAVIYPKKISRTSLEDSFVDVGYHLGKMQDGSVRTIAGKLLTGTAQDEPRGLLTYDSGTAVTGQVEQITSGTSTDLTWDDIVEILPSALKTGYNANATYLMNHASWRHLLVSKDDEARYQMSEIMAMLKMQSPDGDNISVNIRLDAGMPNYSTAGYFPVIYGDFKAGYLMVDRIGFSIIRDETNSKYIIYKLRRRVGGQLRIGEALKILKTKT